MTTAGKLIYVIREAVKMHADLQAVDKMPSVIVTGMKGIANVLMVILGILCMHARSVSILFNPAMHVY